MADTFTPAPQIPEPASGGTFTSTGVDAVTFLTEITTDFKRLKMQKARRTGGVEGRILLNLAFVLGEHYTLYQNRMILTQAIEANKLNLVFNLTERKTNKLIGRLSQIGGDYKSNPDRRDPKAFAFAEIVDRLIKATDQKVDQPSRAREIYFWMAVGGVAIEEVGWDETATIEPVPQFDPTTGELLFTDLLSRDEPNGPIRFTESQVKAQIANGRPPEQFEIYEEVHMVGEVSSRVYSPLQVFIDQSVRSIKELAPDQCLYIAEIKTHGWIAENFGDGVIGDLRGDTELSIITTRFQQMEGASVAGVSLKDIIPVVQGSVGPDDPPMQVVVRRYMPASKANPRGRFTVFIPDVKILKDGPLPLESGEINFVDYHFKPTVTSFWNKDYVTDLIAPQRFLNKRLSQLGEQANAAIYDKILLGGGLQEKDIPADYPGLVIGGINEQGAPNVARLPGPQLPQWFMQSIDTTIKLMDEIAGGLDLTEQTQFPGQLRGPMAVPMLQEILDTEWGPTYAHIGERMARAKQLRLNTIKQYYPATRTMHYMDRDQRDEVFEFHTDDVLRSGTNFTITVERGSLLPELRALREARVRERLQSPLSMLYIDERTGRLDKSKIAADLQFGDMGRESREAQYRKLGAEIVGRLWRGELVPPVLPFYNHAAMMDELEAAMATLEFLKSSPAVQQAFQQRWQQHQQFLQQASAMQQQTMQNSMVHAATAQAVQQSAAEAAAETTRSVVSQEVARLMQEAQATKSQADQALAQTQARAQPAFRAPAIPGATYLQRQPPIPGVR